MKKIILLTLLAVAWLSAENSSVYYESFEGGGIGYTPTFIILPQVDFPAVPNPLTIKGQHYFHGVQGWGTLTEHWRAGATMIAGNFSNSRTSGANIEKTEFSLVSGLVFTEYTMQMSSSSQFAIHLAFGISQLSYSYQISPAALTWATVFSTQTMQKLTARTIPTIAPQISLIYQLSRKTGLRLNTGTHIMNISQTAWKLNDFVTVSNGYGGQNAIINSPFIQIFIYFGA